MQIIFAQSGAPVKGAKEKFCKKGNEMPQKTDKIRKKTRRVSPGTFEYRLNEAMERAQISREVLAKKVYRTPQCVSNWLLGNGNVGLPIIEALAEILQVSPAWLAFGAGSMDISTPPDSANESKISLPLASGH